MKELEVWGWATEIWKKRERIGIAFLTTFRDCFRICYFVDEKEKWKTFYNESEVRRFLDGLE